LEFSLITSQNWLQLSSSSFSSCTISYANTGAPNHVVKRSISLQVEDHISPSNTAEERQLKTKYCFTSSTMASETDYKEAPFADDDGFQKDVPVKVHIIAPITLPEGYVFEAEVGAEGAKRTISVEVVSVILGFL